MKDMLFSKNIFTISSLKELKINLRKTRCFLFCFFFSTKGVESYDTYFCCSFNVVWGTMLHYDCQYRLFFTTKGELCSTFFSLLFFFLKSVGCLQVGYRFIPSMATICRSLSNQSNQSLPDRALESEQ